MFSISLIARAFVGLGIIANAACVGSASRPDPAEAPRVFYTVTGEIALSRHEPRIAALEYAAAAETDRDADFLRRATEVTEECLQPSLTVAVARRWSEVDPASLDAHRAAARAALQLQRIVESAAQYRAVIASSPRGAEAELAALAPELAAAANIFGARQLADRLAGYFPESPAARRLQGFAALRADDPAAAARSLQAALESSAAMDAADRRELLWASWQAQISSGDAATPLALARSRVGESKASADQLDYALLLLAARQDDAARLQLAGLTQDAEYGPAALRLLGLQDFQDADFDQAGLHFAQLLATGQYADDAFYHLGLIAERHADVDRALRLYAQVRGGDYQLPALLRAATVLRDHGAAPAAEALLDRLLDEEQARAPQLLASRSRIYAEAGDLPQAAAVLQQAMLQYPDSVALKYASASLAEDRGQTAEALRELKALARSRPDDPAALNAYGYTLADHRQKLRLARRLIEAAYAAAPKNVAILDSVGWVLYRQGHSAQALPYLTEAYADDRGGDIAAHLGEVLWRLGRQADADRIWAEAGRADADNPVLKATRLRLHASN